MNGVENLNNSVSFFHGSTDASVHNSDTENDQQNTGTQSHINNNKSVRRVCTALIKSSFPSFRRRNNNENNQYVTRNPDMKFNSVRDEEGTVECQNDSKNNNPDDDDKGPLYSDEESYISHDYDGFLPSSGNDSHSIKRHQTCNDGKISPKSKDHDNTQKEIANKPQLTKTKSIRLIPRRLSNLFAESSTAATTTETTSSPRNNKSVLEASIRQRKAAFTKSLEKTGAIIGGPNLGVGSNGNETPKYEECKIMQSMKNSFEPPSFISLAKTDDEGFPNLLISSYKIPPCQSPQEQCNRILNSLGYSTASPHRFQTMRSGYYNEPTRLQLETYGSYLGNIVKQRDFAALHEFLSCGVSTNPSTEYGDSLVHVLCRRGDDLLLQIQLDAFMSTTMVQGKGDFNPDGSENIVSLFQVSNFMGRTALHEACCAVRSSFHVVDMILQHEPYLLFMTDNYGYLPLEYISQEQWPQWNVFLHEKMSEYFPDVKNTKQHLTPPLSARGPNSCQFPNPEFCLTPEMASLVSSGQIPPSQASMFAKRGGKFCNRDNDSDISGYITHDFIRYSSYTAKDDRSNPDSIDVHDEDTVQSSSCFSVDENDLMQFLETYHGDSIGCLDDCSGYADIVCELSVARSLYHTIAKKSNYNETNDFVCEAARTA